MGKWLNRLPEAVMTLAFLSAASGLPAQAADAAEDPGTFSETTMPAQNTTTGNEKRTMPEPILYVDTSEIRTGKLEELKAAINELVAFVDANEPQLISYNFYLNEDIARMTVVAVHPDSASMEFHMKVAGPVFRKFTGLINLSRIEIYGEVSETVLSQLRQKAQMLGSGAVLVNRLHSGFTRTATR